MPFEVVNAFATMTVFENVVVLLLLLLTTMFPAITLNPLQYVAVFTLTSVVTVSLT